MRPAKGEGRVGQDAALSEIQEATPAPRVGILAGLRDLPQFLADQRRLDQQRALVRLQRQDLPPASTDWTAERQQARAAGGRPGIHRAQITRQEHRYYPLKDGVPCGRVHSTCEHDGSKWAASREAVYASYARCGRDIDQLPDDIGSGYFQQFSIGMRHNPRSF